MKKILLDLDGTLLDFKKGEENAFSKTIKKYSPVEVKKEDIKMFSFINERLFMEYSSGKMTRTEFQQQRFKEIFAYLKIDASYAEANEYYVEMLSYQANIYDDIKDTLSSLKEKGDLIIATNGQGKVQRMRLEKCGILSFFKEIYISEEIGYNKPDPRFFEYILKNEGDSDPGNYVMVGDRLESDIAGGNSLGICTVYINRDYNTSYPCVPNYEIHSFDKLLRIL